MFNTTSDPEQTDTLPPICISPSWPPPQPRSSRLCQPPHPPDPSFLSPLSRLATRISQSLPSTSWRATISERSPWPLRLSGSRLAIPRVVKPSSLAHQEGTKAGIITPHRLLVRPSEAPRVFPRSPLVVPRPEPRAVQWVRNRGMTRGMTRGWVLARRTIAMAPRITARNVPRVLHTTPLFLREGNIQRRMPLNLFLLPIIAALHELPSPLAALIGVGGNVTFTANLAAVAPLAPAWKAFAAA